MNPSASAWIQNF